MTSGMNTTGDRRPAEASLSPGKTVQRCFSYQAFYFLTSSPGLGELMELLQGYLSYEQMSDSCYTKLRYLPDCWFL